jgi:hypothetical protein
MGIGRVGSGAVCGFRGIVVRFEGSGMDDGVGVGVGGFVDAGGFRGGWYLYLIIVRRRR